MPKIVTVVGARPQFIKAAMVSKELLAHNLQEIIVHTGQHYDDNMSQIFFRDLGIPKPKYFLDINGCGHGEMTGRMMIRIEEILSEEKPDMLLVYGDTNSTLAGALVARKLGIKVCHVEGGLRSHDLTIPEEVNRILTDRISDVVICPTELAISNLKKEGFQAFPVKIFLTADLMADAFFSAAKRPVDLPESLTDRKFALCTIHRASNTKPEVLKRVVEGLNAIAAETPIYFPIHPRTLGILTSEGLKLSDNIIVSPPIGYFETISLLKSCEFVITDSGGLQREAYLGQKLSILLMSYTPWEELVHGEYTVLSGCDRESMMESVHKLVTLRPDWGTSFYGTGSAAKEIVNILTAEIGV
ncbi:MAG: UDP-N-acetylglucosamine 2-epimerase (non-hydrolyzing) [Proteobacteria bacterium]|nr:MAG: UDP-N-acetylglucosamine 2-epimerase (non-hydrolyzing) [Pseudomonadota bacterium]